MRPRAEILLDGQPVASAFYSVLTSVHVTDELGIESDTVTLVLDEGRGEIALPRPGARIDVRLGFLEQGLHRMGTFAVDAVSGSGPVAKLTLSGTAIDLGSPIRQAKTRSWEAQTLRQITDTIASEAGLRPVVSDDLADTFYAMVAQTAESDLHLLTRLARPLDAVAKAADGRLILAKLGTGRDASGAALAPVPVTRRDLTEWTWSEEEREKMGRVRARWQDLAMGRDEVVEVGDGDPVKDLRKVHATRAEAERAAAAELDRSRRGDLRIHCRGRFQPGLFAGGQVDLRGLRSTLDGIGDVRSVTHHLGGALTTAFTVSRRKSSG
ncbi:phage tail protein [Jannaschia pagri]|uniref:Phage tail protein n=1 Tax=Jannaschia pagri TaxID=2829797 RepID=A0ABQ4NPA0_9RHOB|nr:MULTISPECIES: contractile injection system protein, VgrG/Pvc8 family [unclassified Jannaschia]GIT92409.1 phage tail protein [Jannaschia sp. AI_61]GIT96244.1 phage tail protein [Jannaschia sp. AI_62]